MLDLSIFHVPADTQMKSHRLRAIKVSKNAPKGYRDMMLYICISIENTRALELILVTERYV